MMLKALIKNRLQSLINMWFSRAKPGAPKRSPLMKVGIVVLVLYIVAAFCMMFGTMFFALAGAMSAGGMQWLYFSFVFIMSFALGIVGEVFVAQKQLFDATDNDLLLAMPIPPSYILASRMLMLYILGLAFELLVVAPAGVVWVYVNGATVRGVVVFLVCCCFLPLLVLAVSSLFGWVISLVMARVRRKSLVTTVLSLAFLGAYFYVFGNMNQFLANLTAGAAAIGNALAQNAGWFYPVVAFGQAVAGDSALALPGYILCCSAVFGLVYFILSRTFLKVATNKRGVARIKYREKTLKTSSVGRALIGRELIRLLSNGMVLMNAALSSFAMVIGAVAAVIFAAKVREFVAMMPFGADFMPFVLGIALAACATMNTISASSVSLEGKCVWIVKSMPVSTRDVLMAKVRTHELVTLLPMLLLGVVICVILRLPLRGSVPAILSALLFGSFSAHLGVACNLHFPRLDYTNEVAVVKQGVSLLITLLATMAFLTGVGLLYGLLLYNYMSAELYLLLFSVVEGVLILLLNRYLGRGGAVRFEAL